MDYLLKTKKEYKKFKEIVDSWYIYLNELDKACFQNDKAFGDFKDLSGRAASDKVLCDKAFNINKITKYEYERGLASMVYEFFDKTSSGN